MKNQFHLPYGKTFQILELTDSVDCDLILPNLVKPAGDPQELIASRLESIQEVDLDRLRSAKAVAIAVNDKTRPVPHEVILPPLMTWLESLGVADLIIKFWIATGSHTPMPTEEIYKYLPVSITNRYRVESHDINKLDNLIHLGKTSRGTPVSVNREFYEAGFKIVVGDIEPHHFAGFSGGYKTAAIGLAGRETINCNHAMLVHPNSWIAVYDENPLRQDINEIGAMLKVDMALNTILNHDKQVVDAVAGSPNFVMSKGIPISRMVCGTPTTRTYDVVVASAGGYPKDINFYQAQKALTHASLFCKPGGTILLVAACSEGSGSRPYEEFMEDISSLSEVFERFNQMEFRVGPHKAFQVARLLSRFDIVLISDIASEKVAKLLMTPADHVQEAYDKLSSSRLESCTVAVLPYATTTLPN